MIIKIKKNKNNNNNANNNNGNIAGSVDVEIMVPLKCLSNFWRTLEIPLSNCEIELILT